MFFGLADKASAATYNIGPGQTYTTFTALVAAKTLQPDDIVDGGGNTFNENWIINGSGTSGHPIIIQNATIDGQGVVQQCVKTNSKNYISLSNLNVRNCMYFTIYINSSSYINIDNVSISGKGMLRASAGSSYITISNFTSSSTDASGYEAAMGFYAPGTDVSISSTTISGSNRGAIYSSLTSNVTLNNVEAISGGDNYNVIDINGMTSGNLSLTNIYSGVTRQGVAAGNGTGTSVAIGLYIRGINNVSLNADRIYSSNNGAANILISNSTLTEGSILKNFTANSSVTGDGITIINASNLTIQNGTASYNKNQGITAYGSSTTNLITEYVTASYNRNDGIDGATQNTDDNCPKGWIIRYTESSFNGYNNGVDSATGDGFSIHNTCTANYYYVKSFNNKNTGMAHTGSSGGLIYNSIIVNNGSPLDPAKQNRAGLYLTTNANPGFIVRNNIVSGNYPAEFLETVGQNHNNLDKNLYYQNPEYGDKFYTNLANGTGYITWNTYHSTREENSFNTNPLFTDSTGSDFSLLATSPAIDSGTTTSWMTSTTTDYANHPIYGTPDIGAYEYQPPYTITTDHPQYGSNIRIYGDGKYRYTTATTSSSAANLSVTPVGGYPTYSASTTRPEYLNISDITWGTSKQFTASSSIATSTIYTIGDLTPNTYYTINYNHNSAGTTTLASLQADQDGKITFTYTGGYSTVLFDISPVAPTTQAVTTPTTPTSHSSSGGSTQSQVNNLIAMGNYTLAGEIAKQYGITIPSNTLPQTTTKPNPTNSILSSSSFTRNLKLGMKGLDVKLLQQFLNNNGFPVSKKGVGSKGRENTTFGPATKAALVRFQKANKITPAVGYFGPKTQAAISKEL